MKHILLTGGTGFLGSHLLKALLSEGFQVTLLKRSSSDTWRINHMLSQISTLDIDLVPVEEAFKSSRVDAVIHTACMYGRDNEKTSLIVKTNLLLGIELLESALAHNVKLFINTDTFFNSDILSNHLFDYSLSKRQLREWLINKSQNIASVNLKLQHVYGPYDNSSKFIPWLVENILHKEGRIALSHGNQKRDFVYIKDVVSAYLAIIKRDFPEDGFREFYVGTGKMIDLKFVVKFIFDRISDEKKVSSSLGFGDLVTSGESEVDASTFNTTELELAGWTPAFTLEDGIIDMLFEEGVLSE